MALRMVVVGAGAWGFAAAAELARRGHEVVLVDRHGPGNALSSSSGPTRLWRIADPHRPAVRFGRHAVAALERVAERVGTRVHVRTGLLWRDGPRGIDTLRSGLVAEQVEHLEVAAADVGRHFPGLRPDGRDALWLPDGGPLLAEELLAAYARLFRAGHGELVVGRTVVGLDPSSAPVGVELDDGTVLRADAVVACPGPGAGELLAQLGLDVPLQPFLEQVVHLGTPAEPHRYDDLPCLFDAPTESDPGIYTMPTPGVGYKIGLDDPLRALSAPDQDRTPDPTITARIVERARRDLTTLDPQVVDELVCCWTDSPDGWFVVERVGQVVIACGDSGKGFKYSAAMGETLADLAEGRAPSEDVSAMSATRFAGTSRPLDWVPTRLEGA
ncbi:MAG: FAD-dependent oxidoreductase [Nocardioides sp.]